MADLTEPGIAGVCVGEQIGGAVDTPAHGRGRPEEVHPLDETSKDIKTV